MHRLWRRLRQSDIVEALQGRVDELECELASRTSAPKRVSIGAVLGLAGLVASVGPILSDNPESIQTRTVVLLAVAGIIALGTAASFGLAIPQLWLLAIAIAFFFMSALAQGVLAVLYLSSDVPADWHTIARDFSFGTVLIFGPVAVWTMASLVDGWSRRFLRAFALLLAIINPIQLLILLRGAF